MFCVMSHRATRFNFNRYLPHAMAKVAYYRLLTLSAVLLSSTNHANGKCHYALQDKLPALPVC